MQEKRYKEQEYKLNCHADGEVLHKKIVLDAPTFMLKSAMEKLALLMRVYNRVLRVAKTIANLAGREKITRAHLAESLNFRIMKMKL